MKQSACLTGPAKNLVSFRTIQVRARFYNVAPKNSSQHCSSMTLNLSNAYLSHINKQSAQIVDNKQAFVV